MRRRQRKDGGKPRGRISVAMAGPIVVFLALVASLLLHLQKDRVENPVLRESAVISLVRHVVRLGVMEMRISQLYEVSRENLKISIVPIPFTGQKSLIAVEGSAVLGFDLERTRIESREEGREIRLDLPPAEVLSIDLSFRFIHEDDTILNRITNEDRNRIMEDLRNEVRKTLKREDLAKKLESRIDGLLKALSQDTGLVVYRAKTHSGS